MQCCHMPFQSLFKPTCGACADRTGPVTVENCNSIVKRLQKLRKQAWSEKHHSQPAV